MGQPAATLNDRIMGMCATHQIPSPAGAPMPSPAPMPFSSPLTLGLAMTVQIGGKPAAVQGSSGFNTPPHVGLHATDPHMAPPTQSGRVLVGSTTVQFEGKGAAYTGCQTSICFQMPGNLAGTAATVQIGP
jgi:uncharacterized Zn-binding protein involved in type VI secretion